MAPEHAMHPQGPAEGSQGLTTPLVSAGPQTIAMSHVQGHVHSSTRTTTKPGTPTHAGGSAQPFPALSHFFTPGFQQRSCSAAQGVPATAKAQEGHLTHGQGHAEQCQQGKELGIVQKKAWDGCLQAWQLSEGQSLAPCSRWMRLPEGLAEVETVETGSGG